MKSKMNNSKPKNATRSILILLLFFSNELQCSSKQASALFNSPLNLHEKKSQSFKSQAEGTQETGDHGLGAIAQQTDYSPSHIVKSTEVRRNKNQMQTSSLLKKLNTEFLYDPTIPLLSLQSRTIKFTKSS